MERERGRGQEEDERGTLEEVTLSCAPHIPPPRHKPLHEGGPGGWGHTPSLTAAAGGSAPWGGLAEALGLSPPQVRTDPSGSMGVYQSLEDIFPLFLSPRGQVISSPKPSLCLSGFSFQILRTAHSAQEGSSMGGFRPLSAWKGQESGLNRYSSNPGESVREAASCLPWGCPSMIPFAKLFSIPEPQLVSPMYHSEAAGHTGKKELARPGEAGRLILSHSRLPFSHEAGGRC